MLYDCDSDAEAGSMRTVDACALSMQVANVNPRPSVAMGLPRIMDFRSRTPPLYFVGLALCRPGRSAILYQAEDTTAPRLPRPEVSPTTLKQSCLSQYWRRT